MKSGKQLQQVNAHKGTVTALAFTSDGRAISGGTDGFVKVWDLTNIKATEKAPEK